MATDATLPAAIPLPMTGPVPRARLVVFVVEGQVLPRRSTLHSHFDGLGLEGVACLGTHPRQACFRLQIPMLLSGRRLKEILAPILPGGFVVREVRELVLLLDTAHATAREVGWTTAATLAMVDNLARGDVGRTMVEVQSAVGRALAPLDLAALSHFDFVLRTPATGDALRTLAAVHASLLGGSPAATARPLTLLDGLRPHLGGRGPGKVA